MSQPEPGPLASPVCYAAEADDVYMGYRGREEVVIKPLPKALRGLKGYAGATLIGDGRMALILDVDGLRGQE